MKNETLNHDPKAKTLWDKASHSYKNYQDYIKTKTDKFKLALVDLLYISNFKGGNATINELAKDIDRKLSAYSQQMIEIEKEFQKMALQELSTEQLDSLIERVKSICQLAAKGTETKIDGFSSSYLSALLNAYFPALIPILDRRVLINLGLVKSAKVNSQGQIINILDFYEPLIREIAKRSRIQNKDIREIDRELFITRLPSEFKRKKAQNKSQSLIL